VAKEAERLGHPLYIGSALALGALTGQLIGRKEWAGSALRIGGGVAAAAAASGVLKLAVGRSRPNESPGDADELSPFSGHSSFPSGHTTVAFAFAAGLDAESSAAWVSWVAYPAAALVGWSRLRDNRHWASDVAAGAILGTLVGRRVVQFEQDLAHTGPQSMGVHLDQVGPEGGRRPAIGLELNYY
jgi:membrane-associated phospholipid phosphatase